MIAAQIDNLKQANNSIHKKEELHLTKAEWLWPLAFMLSMSMLGLSFPLGYLLVPLILINRFRKDRYDFIIMLTIFLGRFSLISEDAYFIRTTSITFVISILGILIFRKPALIKKIILAFVAYAGLIIVMICLSNESIAVQIRSGVFNYLSFAYFIIPLLAFSGKEFDIKLFFRKLFPFLFIFCAYYIIDGIILKGPVMMPFDASRNFTQFTPTFYSFRVDPFSFQIIRRWPQGLYLLTLCIYPIVRVFKLSTRQWILIFAALVVSRTFTVLVAYIFVYIMVQGNAKKLIKYTLIGIISIIGLYFFDGLLSGSHSIDGQVNSFLRIKSSIDQIIDIREAQDEEDISALGSGRMAQAIPKIEQLFSLNKQWTGFGFLNRELSTSNEFIIENELYVDIEQSEEVSTGVEIVPIQIILTIGIIGLIGHIIFFVYIWWVVRRLKYSMYYLSLLVVFSIMGISGFSGLILIHGLYLSGLALAAVIMANKREIGGFSLPPIETKELETQ